jgi:hypothetical protein
MGTVNWCPPQSKVYHLSCFLLLSAIFVFRLFKEKGMCVSFFESVECLKNNFLSSLEENKLKKETDRTRQNKKGRQPLLSMKEKTEETNSD